MSVDLLYIERGPGTIIPSLGKGSKLLHQNPEGAHNTNPELLLPEHQVRNSSFPPLPLSFLLTP